MLTTTLASAFARTALANTVTEYPYKLDQILGSTDDLRSPRTLHPAFWGSYDWHSCVHMHWTLARLLRRFPDHPLSEQTRVHLGSRLTAAAVTQEIATLRGPHRQTFERPYGWGWLLKLAAELELLACDQPDTSPWRDALRPLAAEFAERFLAYLPKADFPTRAGTHANSAFALRLALDWCDAIQHLALRRVIGERANRWFGRDHRYPASYEPGGEDFLAAGLVEAVVMLKVVDGCSFADWWEQFQPAEDALVHWLTPVTVSDPADARIVHLHGLNLSRAWCWRLLRPELPTVLRDPVDTAIAEHLAASLPTATAGEYVGTHWLASFALLALDDVGTLM
jgi:Protein of unknown function (DUF2891)